MPDRAESTFNASSHDPTPSTGKAAFGLGPSADKLEVICERFESGWRSGAKLQIEDLLPADAEFRRRAIVELINIELELRIRAGEPARCEDYFARFPELSENRTDAVAMIAREFRLRSERDSKIDPKDFLCRFPQFAADLEKLLSGQQLTDRRPRVLRFNCPHCHDAIQMVEESPSDELVCPTCGSSFRLEDDQTNSWSQERLPRVGKFELLERIGRGTFGTVYRAKDTELDRLVAVKMPRSGSFATKEDEDRFVREGRSVAQLRHPGIVPVYEVGRSGGFPYLASEFVDGLTLSDALTGCRFTFRESAEIIAQAAEALQHAHEHGVVHRDVKPSNIMVTFPKNRDRFERATTSASSTKKIISQASLAGQSTSFSSGPDEDLKLKVRIMDFGLALREEGELTMTLDGQVLGTPAYMSPEQARGDAHRVTGHSDIYSLGAVLFQLLTNELPFRGNVRMLTEQVLNSEPRLPSSLNDRVPKDLDTIAVKCLQKDPAKRFPTAADLAADLRRFIRGDAILARPITRLARGWRWCKRRPLVAGLSAIVAVLLIAMTIVSSLYALRERTLSEDSIRLAQQAQTLRQRAQDALYHNWLHSAELASVARQPGYRKDVWEYLRRAAAIDTENRDLKRVKNIAVSSLGDPIGLPQLENVTSMQLCPKLTSGRLPTGQMIRLNEERRRIVTEDGSTVRGIPDASAVGKINGHAFSKNSRYLGVAHELGLRVWGLASWSSEVRVEGDVIWDVAFHPNEDLLATLSQNGIIELWSVGLGRRIHAYGPVGGLQTVGFSQDGEYLVACGADHRPKLAWIIASTPEKQLIDAHRGMVTRVCFQPTGKILATAGKDGWLRLWDVSTGQIVHERNASPSSVEALAFSPDGKSIATGDWSGNVKLWDVETGRILATASTEGLMRQIWQVLFLDAGKRLAVAGTGAMFLFEVHADDGSWLKRERVVRSDTHDIASLPSERVILGIGNDGNAYAFQPPESLKPIRFPFPMGYAPGHMFSSSSTKTYFVSPGHTLCSVQWVPHKLVFVKSKIDVFPGFAIAVTGDGRWLATAVSHPAELSILNIDSSEELLVLPMESADIRTVSWSSDGSKVAVGLSNGFVSIWKLEAIRNSLGGFGVQIDSTLQTLSSRADGPDSEPSELFAAACHDRTAWHTALPLWEERVRAGEERSGPNGDNWLIASRDLASACEMAGQTDRARSIRLATSRISASRHVQSSNSANREPASNSESDFDRALVELFVNPLGGEAHLQIGMLMADAQQFDFASFELTLGLALQPDLSRTRLLSVLSAVRRCGQWYASQERWAQAAPEFSVLANFKPNDSIANMQAAAVMLAGGDRAGYRRVANEMLKRFRNSRSPNDAERTAKVCLITDEFATELGDLDRLADFAVKAGAQNASIAGYFQFVRGLADYRMGRFASAVEMLRQSRTSLAGGVFEMDCLENLFEAMALFRLGQLDDARSLFKQTTQRMDLGPVRGYDDGWSWHDWLLARVAREEAERMFKQ